MHSPSRLTCTCLLFAAALTSHPLRAADLTAPEVVARRELVAALFQWIDATNARDFDAQSVFYPERMEAFYLWRDVPRAAVLAEKRRVFDRALVIEIDADAPQIIVAPDAQTARMYFRKSYVIDADQGGRRGEVLQELRWEQQTGGWKIVSERDLRVIRHARATEKTDATY